MTVTGTVHHIGPVETFSSGFTKRTLVVHNGSEYDPLVPIEFKKDKGGLLDRLQVGQTVAVSIDLGGREYNGKFYPAITGWKIEGHTQAAPVAAPSVAATPVAADGDDDLPF
jgi:hypothetical protein